MNEKTLLNFQKALDHLIAATDSLSKAVKILNDRVTRLERVLFIDKNFKELI